MGSCQPRRSPMCPEAKVQVLRRTGVLSVFTWPQNFLSLTIRPEEAGGSCQNGRGPKSSQSFTVGPDEAVGSGQHRPSPIFPEAKVQVLRRTGVLLVLTWPHIFLKPHHKT